MAKFLKSADYTAVDEDAKPETEDKKPKRPVCPHAAPPNRFGIKPGYRWDGKVRGNGYEMKFMEGRNFSKLDRTEAYKQEWIECL